MDIVKAGVQNYDDKNQRYCPISWKSTKMRGVARPSLAATTIIIIIIIIITIIITLFYVDFQQLLQTAKPNP